MTKYLTYPKNRPVRLWNVNCPYCGRKFDAGTVINEEHVVGRKFVPKGTMENQFNLILNACKVCNDIKSQLEDDISVISMIPRSASRPPEVEAMLASEVARKAHGSGSRRTGRSVAKSEERVELKGQFGGATFTFGFIAPPQVDEDRAYKLAQMHFDAFFFEAHYSEHSKLGGFFPHRHHYNAGYFPRSNWGDQRSKWFMDTTAEWPLIAAVGTAKGYFRLIIRHSPCQTMWSCAVEWNCSVRVMRILGKDADVLKTLINTGPQPNATWHKDSDGNPTRAAVERELDAADDRLFIVTESEGA
ncbi:hypothetical protein [Acidovorax sp.]|uniref:HNH endonuclease n=1 Tax=Acidovorax sp. TaxID=1872122 RepID=UPI002ACE49E0|nr:hypothetical protein [Acidovorax sp.]MDZ7862468.1 hypothetical protein [Acidovorax sp.]